MTFLSESGYRVFNPGRFGFPAPRVPILPVRFDVGGGDAADRAYVPVTDGRGYRFFAWGRYALLEAFRLSKVGPTGCVLIPAYHCRTMLDPALSLQGEILLYPLDAELKPELQAIEKLIGESTIPVRALVATHYFGFPQPLAELKALCDEHGVVLIEDCSHAFFRPRHESTLGSLGRFVVASPYKFCPTMDGGVLIGNGEEGAARLSGRSLRDEFSLAMRLAKRAKAGARSYPVAESAWGSIVEREDDHVWEQGRCISPAYDPSSALLEGSRLSHWIVRHSSADRIARRRRANFAKWLEGVAAFDHCRPLYPMLPDGVVPYMFPLLLDRPLPDFYRLKLLGIPIWRWDSMGISGCSVAMDYRLRLLHLPCHQDIRTEEMDWMLATLEQVLNCKETAI